MNPIYSELPVRRESATNVKKPAKTDDFLISSLRNRELESWKKVWSVRTASLSSIIFRYLIVEINLLHKKR